MNDEPLKQYPDQSNPPSETQNTAPANPNIVTPTVAPAYETNAPASAPSGGQSFSDSYNLLLVILLLSSFLIPGLGLVTVPLILYFAVKGVRTRKGFSELDATQKLVRIIGWICISLIVLFVGLITLLIIIFSSGDFKLG